MSSSEAPEKRSRLWLVLLPVIVFAGLALLFWKGLSGSPNEVPSALIDKPVPDFLLNPVDGLKAPGFADEDLKKGKVTVVNVWASWCAPCRAEAGVLESTYVETKAKGVEFVGIVSGGKDSIDNAKAFSRKFEVSYPSMFDSDNSLVLAFRGQLPPSAIPTTLVLDREGRVAARALGAVDRSRLLGMIEPVLAETP